MIIKYIKDDEVEQYESQGWHKGVPDFVKNKEREANLGEKNGFYGKQHSEETKQKLSETRSGSNNWNFGKMIYHKDDKEKYISAEDVEYYESNGWIKGHSQASKDKISVSNMGRKVSEERLRKISNIYSYDNKEFIGWRKLQLYLRENGYPKISESAIVKLSNNISVRGYDDLLGKITYIKEGNL